MEEPLHKRGRHSRKPRKSAFSEKLAARLSSPWVAVVVLTILVVELFRLIPQFGVGS